MDTNSHVSIRELSGILRAYRWRLACFGLIIFGFAVSRWIFAACGNGFDTSEWMWQIVGFDLLRSRLTQSLFYLHSQPPLLNLGLGIVLKLTPDPHHAQELLRNSFRLMGLLLVLVLFQLMLDLDIPIAIALGLILLFEFNPGTLVLENWYYAPYPTEFCLCACAFCLNRFLAVRRRKYGIGLLVFAVLPVFLNSSFQPLWFICVLVFLFFCGLDSVRELIPASLIILGLLAILLVKNAIVSATVMLVGSVSTGFAMTSRATVNANGSTWYSRTMWWPRRAIFSVRIERLSSRAVTA